MPFNKNLQYSWLLFWAVASLLLALTIWPFATNQYPAMPDFANHLARLHLLTGQVHDGWQEYYYLHQEIVPNLALDIIASGFVSLGLSPRSALMLFAAITNILVVVGVISISYAINRRPPWLALWAFIFAFNRYFIWGFLNYFFSIGIGFLVFSLWVLADNKKYQNIWKLVLSFLMLTVLLSHLMGYGITLICIFAYEFSKTIQRRLNFSEQIKHLSKSCAYFLPSFLFYVFVCVHGESHEIIYQDYLRSKVSGLISPFLSYNFLPAFIYIQGFIFVLYLISRKKSGLKELINAHFPNGLFLLPLVFVFLFFVLPTAMMGSWYLDKRFFIVAVLIVIAISNIEISSKSVIAIIITVITLHVVKIYEVNNTWIKQSIVMPKISRALNTIPVNAKIESFSFGDSDIMPIPTIHHAVTMAITQRAALVPTLFALPVNLESVGYKNPYDEWAYSTGTFNQNASLEILRYACDNWYDYYLITYMNKVPKVPKCLQVMISDSNFTLYHVNRDYKD